MLLDGETMMNKNSREIYSVMSMGTSTQCSALSLTYNKLRDIHELGDM